LVGFSFFETMPFSDAQKSTLLTYFRNGMVGVGRKYTTQINAAAAETGLTERQIEVIIIICVFLNL
jgi:hypothetical protein